MSALVKLLDAALTLGDFTVAEAAQLASLPRSTVNTTLRRHVGEYFEQVRDEERRGRRGRRAKIWTLAEDRRDDARRVVADALPTASSLDDAVALLTQARDLAHLAQTYIVYDEDADHDMAREYLAGAVEAWDAVGEQADELSPATGRLLRLMDRVLTRDPERRPHRDDVGRSDAVAALEDVTAELQMARAWAADVEPTVHAHPLVDIVTDRTADPTRTDRLAEALRADGLDVRVNDVDEHVPPQAYVIRLGADADAHVDVPGGAPVRVVVPDRADPSSVRLAARLGALYLPGMSDAETAQLVRTLIADTLPADRYAADLEARVAYLRRLLDDVEVGATSQPVSAARAPTAEDIQLAQLRRTAAEIFGDPPTRYWHNLGPDEHEQLGRSVYLSVIVPRLLAPAAEPEPYSGDLDDVRRSLLTSDNLVRGVSAAYAGEMISGVPDPGDDAGALTGAGPRRAAG